MEFIETPAFARTTKDLLNEEAIRELQSFLLQNPEAGDLISGAGGVRKIRWAAQNKGKRAGARVIYLTPAEKRLFAQLAKQLLNEKP